MKMEAVHPSETFVYTTSMPRRTLSFMVLHAAVRPLALMPTGQTQSLKGHAGTTPTAWRLHEKGAKRPRCIVANDYGRAYFLISSK